MTANTENNAQKARVAPTSQQTGRFLERKRDKSMTFVPG